MRVKELDVLAGGMVDCGKLTLDDPEAVKHLLNLYPGRTRVLVRIERLKATRSAEANRYWWGVCVELVSAHTGYTPEEIHELAKQKFLPKSIALKDGNGTLKDMYVIGGSTAKLDGAAFWDFVERFREWAAMELDVVIPDPEHRGHGIGVARAS